MLFGDCRRQKQQRIDTAEQVQAPGVLDSWEHDAGHRDGARLRLSRFPVLKASGIVDFLSIRI